MNRLTTWIAGETCVSFCSSLPPHSVYPRLRKPGSHARGPAQVVFVCEHGSVKSLVAAVYFNRQAQERRLPYRGVARGTAPQPDVPGPVREGLRDDGFEFRGFRPRLCTGSDLDGAVVVVSFDQDITKTVRERVRHLRWDGLPALLSDYSRGRDAIVRHVDALVDDLAHSASP